MASIAPALLVAVPQMRDPNFSRTVTLLVDAGEEGAFGLILNRPSPVTLAEICATNDLACTRDLIVHMGGPVEQERAWILHGPGYGGEHSYAVSKDLLITPTWETLAKLATSSESENFQVYLGYAGWGPKQLEAELAEGSWLLADVDREVLFDRTDPDIWRTVIHKMGLDPGTIAPGGGGVH